MVRKRVEVPKIETVGAFLSHSPDPTAGHAQKAHISEIHLPQQQPRRYFDPEKLESAYCLSSRAWHSGAAAGSSVSSRRL